MLGEMIDEIVPWQVKNQWNLMNAIFSQTVNLHVQELRKKKCCGCEVNHPSERRYDCIIMTKEGWITHGLEAVEHVLQQAIYGNSSGKLSESRNSFLTNTYSNTFKNCQVITKPPWNS